MRTRKNSRYPTALSAFTGAGGLDLGLASANFRIVGCIENDETARQTLTHNCPKTRLLQPSDITKLVKTSKLTDLVGKRGQLDLLAGGPPCQPFSKAAQWTKNGTLGMKDPRSEPLRAFMTLAERLLPRVVLIENVPGFIRGRHSAVAFLQDRFDAINTIHKTKYKLHYELLDAVDYGVAQRRQRAILVARRDGKGFTWPKPTHELAPITAYDALRNIRATTVPAPAGKWADLLSSIPEGQNYLWHTSNGGGKKLFGYRTRYWSFLLKLAKNQPAWTLSAFPGPATGPFHWTNRPLTIKEMLRLQSFPASWRIAGDFRSQVRQVGNATPPLLAEIVGRAIGEQLFGIRYRRSCRLRISRTRIVPPPEVVCEIPEAYAHLEGDYPAHPGTGLGPSPRRKRKPRVHKGLPGLPTIRAQRRTAA